MTNTSNYTWKIDTELRDQGEALFDSLGMDIETAINIFLRKAVSVGGFPFDVDIDFPNGDTVEVLLEGEYIARDLRVGSYSVDEAFKELEK